MTNLENWLNDLRYRLGTAMYRLGATQRENLKAELGTMGRSASNPGEPPHDDTGALQDGVSYDVEDDLGREVRLRVASARADGDPNVPVWLEYGTDKMPPHPYMRPNFDALRGTLLTDAAQLLREQPA